MKYSAEKQEKTERRWWSLYNLLAPLLWLMKFRIRNLWIGKFPDLPESEKSMPIEQLQTIELELVKETIPVVIQNKEHLLWVMELFNAVGGKNGVINEMESDMVQQFLAHHSDPLLTDEERRAYLDHFLTVSIDAYSPRWVAHELYGRISHLLAKQIMSELYLLSFADDRTEGERKMVEDIGFWLKIAPNDLRLLEKAGKFKAQQLGVYHAPPPPPPPKPKPGELPEEDGTAR